MDTLGTPTSRFNKIDADLMLLKWMTGFILAGVTGVLIKAFVG